MPLTTVIAIFTGLRSAWVTPTRCSNPWLSCAASFMLPCASMPAGLELNTASATERTVVVATSSAVVGNPSDPLAVPPVTSIELPVPAASDRIST